MIKPWRVWAFWVSPLSYGQRAISVNKFTAKRWMEGIVETPYILAQTMFYGIITYFMINFERTAKLCFSRVLLAVESHSGFLVPKPSIPEYWIWYYYICPMVWTLRAIITSQLGDVEIIIRGQDFEGSVKDFINVL